MKAQVTETGWVKKWKSTQMSIMKNIFPDVKEKELEDYLDKKIATSIIDPMVKIHNNYSHLELDISLLKITDWIEEKAPICAGFGMFYMNQNMSVNPNAKMIVNFLDLRKTFKDLLEKFKEDTYDYMTADRRQLTEKINANSFYGCNGSVVSRFFNIFTASSVTLTGQSLISTTAEAFEAFLANNVQFFDLDNCFEWLEKVKGEEYNTTVPGLPNATIDAVFGKLIKMFTNFKTEYELPLYSYLCNCEQLLLNKFFFKNNVYDFMNIDHIRGTIRQMMEDVDTFMNPSQVPDVIKSRVEHLWDKLRDWVFYNHSPIGRIERLKNQTRRCVVTVDTDSNMITLDPWVEFVFNEIVPESPELAGRDYDNIRFTSINLMCTFLTKMINEVLQKYTARSHIPAEHRYRINMKNEFLFTKMMITPSKKRYITSVRLREGKEILPEKVDIKGLDFMKATTRKETMDRFKGIIKDRFINHDTVDLMGTLEDLGEFESHIRESLYNGEKKYLNPSNVKEPEAYADPDKMPQLRAVLNWNAIYPEQQIGLPENVDLVKLNVSKIEDLAGLARTNPELYGNIRDGIYKSQIAKMREKGLNIIAIPRTEKEIPSWIIDYIDFDGIINKNMTQFKSVLEAMSLMSVEMDKMTFFTNIRQIG